MLGIDPGGRQVAIFDVDRVFTALLPAPNNGSRGDELKWIADALRDLDLQGQAWVEAPVVAGARNLQSTLQIAQVTGVVHAVLTDSHQVAVSSWKKRTTGKGNADKAAVRAWLDLHHPEYAERCAGNQDLYDACCIALFGASVRAEVDASGLGAHGLPPDAA